MRTRGISPPDTRPHPPTHHPANPATDRRRSRRTFPDFAADSTFLCLLLVLLPIGPLVAADKNGVAPSAISLPKGPGSLEGLGESFQPTLNTGSATYGFAITLPPGTAGHQPSLRLRYDGGAGNGVLGYGWSLPLPAIQRRSDQGIPLYGENVGFDRPDRFINESKEELVPQADGHYFCENEGSFVRYRRVGDHWEGTLPDGTQLSYGLTAEGRVEDSASGHVFSWLLERERDTRGNTIVYAYQSFPGDRNRNHKYLRSVTYGPGEPPFPNFHFAAFEYEDRSDGFEDGRSGFLVRCGKRMHRIRVGTQQGGDLPGHREGDWNGDGQRDFLSRQYELGYLTDAGNETHGSLLGSIQVVGSDGTSRLPPTTLGYAVSRPPQSLSAEGQILGGIDEPPAVMDTGFVELADANGDGLPDILRTFGGDQPHQVFLNRGVKPGTQALTWGAAQEIAGDARAWNVNLQSASSVAHLADMNGDGLADLVVKEPTDEVFFFANQGNLRWADRLPMSSPDAPPPSPFGLAGVRTADLDFDKRMDVIQSVNTGGGIAYRIWYNLGDQRYAPVQLLEPPDAFDLADPSVQVTDFNGDRVPELIRLEAERLLVKPGLGYGRFADTIAVAVPDVTLSQEQLRQAKLIDVTGDGLSDLVLERAAPGRLWYWINRGNDELSPKHEITQMPTVTGRNAVVRWADMNGNGTTDLVYADGESIPRLQTLDVGEIVNGGAYPNLLTSVANGLGRTTILQYRSSIQSRLEDESLGQPWPHAMPIVVPVVAAVRVEDSLGHHSLAEYRYHDGFYASDQKQFRGFGRVEQIEVGDPTAPTLLTRFEFDTGIVHETMKGKLLRQTTESENGLVFWDEATTWTVPPRILKTGTNGRSVRFVHPVARHRRVIELGTGSEKQTQTEYDFDEYGNRTLLAEYGIVENGDRGAFNDERITATDFAVQQEPWNLRHPKQETLRTLDGSLISHTEYHYDDETFSGNGLGQLSAGNLTLKREWISPTNAGTFVNVSRVKYDRYGNPLLLLDPLAVAPQGAVDLSKGHVREIDYDARFHAFPTRETLHIGAGAAPLVFQAAYDEAFGTLLKATHFNGQPTSYAYDAFARLTSVLKPGDSPSLPTTAYRFALAVPVGQTGLVNYVEVRQLGNPAGASPYLVSRQFLDGLGRTLMTKQQAEPSLSNATPRVVVKGATLFNSRQIPSQVLNPFFSLLPADSLESLLDFENLEEIGWKGRFNDEPQAPAALDLASAPKTRLGYDATLRESTATNQDGTSRQTLHEPLVTRSLDENQSEPGSPFQGAATVRHLDGLGRLTQVDEITRVGDNGQTGAVTQRWSTRYQYDAKDQLTRLIDANGNEKRMTYDGLGRKTVMNDPDRGGLSYAYDDASNLIQTTDAKGQRIVYSYDGANRLLTETHHGTIPSVRRGEDRGEGPVHVAYHYDVPAGALNPGDGSASTARNTQGMLSFVSDASGEEHRSFDERGRVESILKRIPDPVLSTRFPPSTVLVNYRTTFEYDSSDRITRLVYPDNDEIRYEYNERGLLSRIAGGPSGSILSGLTYAPSGQPQQSDYGNGIRTRHSYDTRLRLHSLNSHPVSRATEPLLAFSYEYDGASNIRAILDQRPGSVALPGDPRRNSQGFQYDDLYRLTRAQYSFALPGEPLRDDGSIEYRYDRVGNMLSQTSDIDHRDRGVSATDAGDMEFGGSLGASNRKGRGPSDPPGPHAVTRILNPRVASSPPRNIAYDPNGNMIEADGRTYAWDIKDRLVRVEDAENVSEYVYDYADRRIIKRVTPKPDGATPGAGGSRSVLYVDPSFEVRQHDAPIKYVFHGSVRVARVAGSLSANRRLQRIRIEPGWNLASLAVEAEDFLGQLSGPDTRPAVDAVYQWQSETRSFVPVKADVPVPAGTVIWLQTRTHGVLTVRGSYPGPKPIRLTPEGGFVGSSGLESWSLDTSLPVDAAIWKYLAGASRWSLRLPSSLDSGSDLPRFVAPGEVLFVVPRLESIVEPAASDPTITYYHQDHLGSSSVLSDTEGRLVEENAFYPFGFNRVRYRPRPGDEPYQFAQVERDAETGLDSYPARYGSSLLGRFLQPDPLFENNSAAAGGAALSNPQKLNPYSYVRNNPVRFVDPNGLDETDPPARVAPAQSAPATSTAAPYGPPVASASPSNPSQSPPSGGGGVSVTIPGPKPDPWQRAAAAREDAGGMAAAAPKAGGAEDVVGALGAVQLNGKSVQDRATKALTQPLATDWARAKPGEKAAVVGAGIVMVGVAVPALQNKEAVGALQRIVPKVEIPIPLGKGLELKASVSTTKPEGGITLGGHF